jgi:opacity protein-like surface antigen
MKKLFIIAVVGLFLIPMVTESYAGIRVGPRLGFYKAQDADEGKMAIGLGARMRFASLGAEASIDYHAEKYMNGLLTVRKWPVMASLLIYPLPVVYGIAGFGWYNTTADFDQSKAVAAKLKDETKQEVGWHFGAGLELPLGPSSKLAADVRYVFLNYDFAEVPGQGDQKANFYAITVGLFFGL